MQREKKRGRETSEETPADVQDIDSEHLNQETDEKKAEERMDWRHSSHFVGTTCSACWIRGRGGRRETTSNVDDGYTMSVQEEENHVM